MSFWVSTWLYSTNTYIFNSLHVQANVKVKLDIKKWFTSLSTGIFHVKEQLHAQPHSLKFSFWISSSKKLPQWCMWYFKWIKVSQSSILRGYLMQFSTLVHIRQDMLNITPIQMLILFQNSWTISNSNWYYYDIFDYKWPKPPWPKPVRSLQRSLEKACVLSFLELLLALRGVK